MDDSLAIHTLANASFAQQLHGALLEHAGANAVLDVLAAAALEDDALDSGDLEQPCECQARGARADDRDLSPHDLVPLPAIDSASLAEHDAVMRRPRNAEYACIFDLPASLPDDLVLSPETRDHYWKGH
jgi:hypothetical protein